jgi:hypothetical protein
MALSNNHSLTAFNYKKYNVSAGRLFSPGTPVSYKTDHHGITEILLKVT